MPERTYQPDEKLEPYMKRLKELYEALFQEGGDNLAGLAIVYLFVEARMTITDLQKLKARSPSSYVAKWEAIAPAPGLRADLDIDQLDLFTVPIAILPPSIHRESMKNATRWMGVYQEPPSHTQEEARVRLLGAVRVFNLLHVHLLSSAQSVRCSMIAWSTGPKLQCLRHQKHSAGKLNMNISCSVISSYLSSR